MMAGMARQIRTIELILGPAFRASRFERKAIGLGAAPWKMVLVTRATTTGRSELTMPNATPNDRPSMKRILYGLT